MNLILKKKSSDISQGEVDSVYRRITDGRDFDERILNKDSLVRNFIDNPSFVFFPNVLPGRPIDSNFENTFLKDSKYFVSSFNSQLNSIEKEIENFYDSFESDLNSLDNYVSSVSSEIEEEEIKIYEGYTKVHVNRFSRSRDYGEDDFDFEWNKNFKTKQPFSVNTSCFVIDGLGLSLPIRSVFKNRFNNCFVVSNKTDFGTTRQTVETSNPVSIINEDETFKHVIVKDLIDSNGLYLKKEEAKLTIRLDYGTYVFTNLIEIILNSSSKLDVSKLSYVNESSELEEIEFNSVSNTTNLLLYFDAIRCSGFEIEFTQKSSIAAHDFFVSKTSASLLNEVLSSFNFESRIEEEKEKITGYIYDFSIKNISSYLMVFKDQGTFKSKPIAISKLLSFAMDDKEIDIEKDTIDNKTFYKIPNDWQYVERYLCLELYKEENLIFKEQVPCLDSESFQIETLIPVGKYAYVKFLPSLKVDDVDLPIVVMKDESYLTIGLDYEISFDGGKNFFNYFPEESEIDLKNKTQSDFIIKFNNVKIESNYFVLYKPYKVQYLNNKNIMLKNNKIFLLGELSKAKGYVSVFLFFKGKKANSFFSPILNKYTLRLNENVNK